ncbi:MAG: hypothetical protein ABW034_16145, partial [Steroidobacteraceae bacterium]
PGFVSAQRRVTLDLALATGQALTGDEASMSCLCNHDTACFTYRSLAVAPLGKWDAPFVVFREQ